MPSPCCSLRHSVARPDGARSRALSPVRLCALMPPLVRQGRHDLSRVRLALVRASMLRIDAARVTLTAGIARITLAGVRGSGSLNVDKGKSTHFGSGDGYAGAVRGSISPAHILGPCPPAARRLPAAGRRAASRAAAPGPASPLHHASAAHPWAMSASCTSAQGRSLCPCCSPVAPPPPSSAHLPAPTAANALRVRGFGGAGGAPLPRHFTASGRRGQDGLRPACGG